MTKKAKPLIINGWKILYYSAFTAQLKALRDEVKNLKEKDPDLYLKKEQSRRLAVIEKVFLKDIPQNPNSANYRQGKTLGKENKHWRRAKCGQQHRLFFRYDSTSKIIVFAWVNDLSTKREYGSKNDAYAVFRKMIESGHPPNKFSDLVDQSDSDFTI